MYHPKFLLVMYDALLDYRRLVNLCGYDASPLEFPALHQATFQWLLYVAGPKR